MCRVYPCGNLYQDSISFHCQTAFHCMDIVVKNSPANVGDIGFNHWVGKIPWRWTWQPTPVFLPVKSKIPIDRGAWQATVHGVEKTEHINLWTHYTLFLHSSVDAPLGCFYICTVMTNTTMNIREQAFVGTHFFISLVCIHT